MKKLKITSITIILFVLGFFREFVFENINIQLYYLWEQQPNPYLPSTLSFLKNLSYWQLYGTKFLLIVLFTVLYLFGSLYVVRLFFIDKIYQRYSVYFFVGIFGLSGLIFGIGYMAGIGHEAYGISRKLIEFIQSPLACFFLVPAFMLHKKEYN